jgi:copper chaperone
MEKVEFKVIGMSCGHCKKVIEGSVGSLPGVEDVLVDLKNGSVAVKYDCDRVTLGQIKEMVEEQGYDIA